MIESYGRSIAACPAHAAKPHDPYPPGLHHLCFQVADEGAVDEAFRELRALAITATEPRRHPEYDPDCHATFLADPDGIRLESVARTPYREQRARRWADFRSFLDPVADLHIREGGSA